MGIIETNLKMRAMETIKVNQVKIPELGSMMAKTKVRLFNKSLALEKETMLFGTQLESLKSLLI